MYRQFENACESLAIHVQERLEKFLDRFTRMWIRECAHLLDERLDLLSAELIMRVLLHKAFLLYRKQWPTSINFIYRGAISSRPVRHAVPQRGRDESRLYER